MIHSLRSACLGVVLFAACSAQVFAAASMNILALGDSITAGWTDTSKYPVDPGGYREELYKKLTADGYHPHFVGPWTDTSSPYLNALGETAHAGYTAYAIQQVPGTWRGVYEAVSQGYDGNGAYFTDAMPASQKPDYILLMIGTNDINPNIDCANAPARLNTLITYITGWMARNNPSAHLIVSSILPVGNGPYDGPNHTTVNDRVAAFNTAVQGLVATHAKAGEHVTFFDGHALLTTADLVDGLHPTAGGDIKLGDGWAGAVEAAVPEPTSLTLLGAAGLLLGRRNRRPA